MIRLDGKLLAFFLLISPAMLCAQENDKVIDSIRTAVIDTVLISKKIVEFEANKFTFHVSRASEARGKTLEDMLRITPGLQVDRNGNVALFGLQAVEILINDKPVHLQKEEVGSYLKSIPAEGISRIEVVPNPSFGQSANGQPIVRVYLKKRENDGYSANLTAGLDMRHTLSENVSFFSTIRVGKLTLSPVLSVRDDRERTYTNFHAKTGVGLEEAAATNDREDDLAKSFGLDGDYPLSASSSISGMFAVSHRGQENSASGSGRDTVRFSSDRRDQGAPLSLRGGLHYEQKFGESASLIVDGNLTDFDNKMSDYLKINDITTFSSSAKSAVNKADARANFTKSIRGLGEFSVGSRIESNRHDIANDYFRYGILGADRTKYIEQIWQNYLTAEVSIGRSLSLQAGGKVESSHIELETDAKSTRRYHDFLPNLTITYQGGKAQLALSYSKMLFRPYYADLDPRPRPLSKHLFQRGNVALSPEIWELYSANYVFRSGIILYGMMLSRLDPVVYSESRVDGNGLAFIAPANLRTRQRAAVAGITVRRGGERWNYSVDNTFLYADNLPVTGVKKTISYRMGLFATLKNIFRSGTNFSFDGRFGIPYHDLNKKRNAYLWYFFDFSRDFGKNTSLGLKIANPWVVFRNETRYNYDGGAFRNESVRPDIRSFNLYFSQRFGSDKLKSANRIENEDSRLKY